MTGHLFDDETNELKGHAAWQWVDESEDDYTTSDGSEPSRTLTPEEQELAEQIAALIVVLIVVGVAKATPQVVRFFKEKVAPAAKSAWARARSIRMPKRKGVGAPRTAAEPHQLIIVETETSTALAIVDPALTMSAEEWKHRYELMLAADAFSEEQRRVLSRARIVDPASEVNSAATSAEVLARIKFMIEQNPTLLNESFSAELLKVLRTQAKPGREAEGPAPASP